MKTNDVDTYWARRILVDALIQALPSQPYDCHRCGWPRGGSGKYICLCETQEAQDETTD